MIKITRADNGLNETRWIVEGRLVGPWVEELEKTIKASASANTRIDISAINFADDRGLKLLHRLKKSGAILEAASPFLNELLLMNRNKRR